MVVVEVLVDDELRFHRLVKIQLYLVLSVMVVESCWLMMNYVLIVIKVLL